jgi:hypothetical protein
VIHTELFKIKSQNERHSDVKQFYGGMVYRFNRSIDFSLAQLQRQNLLKLAFLRNENKLREHQQSRFERKVTKRIKSEFDALKHDVQTQMELVGRRAVRHRELTIGYAINAVQKAIRHHDGADEFRMNERSLSAVLNHDLLSRFEEIEKTLGRLSSGIGFAMTPVGLDFSTVQKAPELQHEKEVAERTNKVLKEIETLNCKCRSLRIITAMNSIAIRRMYSQPVEKALEDRKSQCASFWHGKRVFEEDMNSLSSDLNDGYVKLNELELEKEDLATELSDLKFETTGLLHKKEVARGRLDQIYHQSRKLKKEVGDVNVSKLISKIEERHKELDVLESEAEDFEDDVEHQVREPSRRAQRSRRSLQRLRIESSGMRREMMAMTLRDDGNRERYELLKGQNQLYKEKNAEMKARIEEIESELEKRRLGKVKEHRRRRKSGKSLVIPDFRMRRGKVRS